jgi:hypothetical protein
MAFLQEGETIILEERVKSDFFGKGTLYLTNTRIMLEVNSGGLLFKKPEIKIDQPVRSIKEISSGRKTLQVHFTGNMEPTTLYLDNPEKWAAAIKTVLTMSGNT